MQLARFEHDCNTTSIVTQMHMWFIVAAELSDHSIVLTIFMYLNQLRGLLWNAADSARPSLLF